MRASIYGAVHTVWRQRRFWPFVLLVSDYTRTEKWQLHQFPRSNLLKLTESLMMCLLYLRVNYHSSSWSMSGDEMKQSTVCEATRTLRNDNDNDSVMPDAIYQWLNFTLRWRHNGSDGVSNHQPHDCLLNILFRRKSKKTSKLRVTGLWTGNSPVTGEFPAQRASKAENVSIWWRHHEYRVKSWSYSNGILVYSDFIKDCNLYWSRNVVIWTIVLTLATFEVTSLKTPVAAIDENVVNINSYMYQCTGVLIIFGLNPCLNAHWNCNEHIQLKGKIYHILTHLPLDKTSAGDILGCIFVNEKFCILTKLKFILKGPNDNNPASF